MKKVLVLAAIVSAVSPAMAVIYNDALGDVNAPMTTYGNANVDLASLEITNTATSISFKFATNSPSITSPDWIKLNVVMRLGGGPLDAGANGNGWSRPYALAGGADRFIGGWVDGGGGFEARQYNGTAWNLNGATYNSTAGMSASVVGNMATYTVDLATLGLSLGDTFTFDATTTGGGNNDGAWDPLSMSTGQVTAPDQASVLGSNLQYTVVPEPASMTALALGAAAMLRRRKRA